MADIFKACNPEQRIHKGMHKHVGIGVPFQPAVVFYVYPSQDERPPVNKTMQIIPRADAVQVHNSPFSSAAAILRSCGLVIFTFSGSPGTVATLKPSSSSKYESSVA